VTAALMSIEKFLIASKGVTLASQHVEPGDPGPRRRRDEQRHRLLGVAVTRVGHALEQVLELLQEVLAVEHRCRLHAGRRHQLADVERSEPDPLLSQPGTVVAVGVQRRAVRDRCRQQRTVQAAGTRPRDHVDHNAPPLLAYRAANCAKSDTLGLKRVLTAVPQFDEAAYALGNVVVWFSGETGGDDARKYYASAYARFPHAAGVTFMSGWLNLNVGDCREAIRYFDETVAMQPEHERAILQTAICQSTLHEDSAAIATTTRFIALETPDIATGYYWRAISRLRRKELEMARSDIELAKARSRAAEVLTAAGIIEFEQADFTIAETDLRGARAAPKGDENCNAGFYLGSVLTKREAWAEAAASYDSAMVCYDDKANVIAAKIEQVRQSRRGSAAFRAKRIASLEADLADRRKRNQTSAFNAASMNARLGNLARAAELLQVAAQSPDPGGSGREAERTARAGAAAPMTRP